MHYYSLLVVSFVVISAYAWRQASLTDAQLNLQYRHRAKFSFKSVGKNIISDSEIFDAFQRSDFSMKYNHLKETFSDISYLMGFIDSDTPYPIVQDTSTIVTLNPANWKSQPIESQQKISIQLAQNMLMLKVKEHKRCFNWELLHSKSEY